MNFLAFAAFCGSIVAQAPTPPPPAPKDIPAPKVAQDDAASPRPKKRPTCEEQRRRGRYNIYFEKVEIAKLVQTVSDVTCKTFILPENIRGKISIIGPENGKVEVNANQFLKAFLAALDANNLTVYEHGKFMKIIEKNRAKQFPIPTITDTSAPYTTDERMVTRLFKIKYADVDQLRGVLQQLVSPSGDTLPFKPDTIIVNDLGSNMHRLEKIVEKLDRLSASENVQVIQIQYATAQEIADKVKKLFTAKPLHPQQQGRKSSLQTATASETVTLSQLIPDERTNKLIVIASPAAMERINALIREIDIPISGEGRINVLYLKNADAEEVASTLQTLAQGTTGRSKKSPSRPSGARARTRGGTAALFQGEVKISADKATNSLVIIANQSDYRNLLRVIERLDIQRRQVFIEAVIMEVNIDRSSELSVNVHTGIPVNTDDGIAPAFIGTKYNRSGAPPSLSIANLVSMGGFLAGLQGPAIPNVTIGGVSIPSFGIVLNALQTSSDVNVLSTPHLLTTDNEEAEITVGQNVPFQSGFSTGGLSNLGAGNTANVLSQLGGIPFGSIQRQNVDLKLSIKPQINESNYIRLVINEQIEEIASQDAVLGPTTSKRTAKTTVVAKDQETVVIGGIMQERRVESVSKVPLLGDIPLLGNLFRSQTYRKVKTNLLLFLTPYIIRDSSDFRRIFERKMQEQQKFVEQFYGTPIAYNVPIDFARKPGPMARIGQLLYSERQKIEHGGPGFQGEQLIQPQDNETEKAPAEKQAPKTLQNDTHAVPKALDDTTPKALKVQPESQE